MAYNSDKIALYSDFVKQVVEVSSLFGASVRAALRCSQECNAEKVTKTAYLTVPSQYYFVSAFITMSLSQVTEVSSAECSC